MNDMSIKQFTESLQLEALQSLLTFQENDYTETFLDADYTVSLLKAMFTGVTYFFVLLYLWYVCSVGPSLWTTYKKTGIDMELGYSTTTQLIIPIITIVLGLSIFSSYVRKQDANTQFNKDIMKDNTNTMKEEIDAMSKTLTEIQVLLKPSDFITRIGDVSEITDDVKNKIYESLKKTLVAYDKCNYIIGSNRYEVPFPYAEIFANGLMVAILVVLIVYVFTSFMPVERIQEVKSLYEYREAATTLANDSSFYQEVTAKAVLSEDRTNSLFGITKNIAAFGVLVFMIWYSVKVIDSSKAYSHVLRDEMKNNNAKRKLCVR